jgi:hypothetical protein
MEKWIEMTTKFSRLFFCLFLIGVSSVYPQASLASTCSGTHSSILDSKFPSLAQMKETVLKIASNPSIRNRILRIDSKGSEVEFMSPLVKEVLAKSKEKLSDLYESSDQQIKFFEMTQNFVLERLQRGELTYEEIYNLPFIISRYFHSEIFSPVFLNDLASHHADLMQFVSMGIYPLPMVFSPSFEIRALLFALKTPPISITTKTFVSYLDQHRFAPIENPLHDEGHVLGKLANIKILTSQRKKMLSDLPVEKDELLRALQLTGQIETEMISAARGLKVGKEVALFFLHQLFVESDFYFHNFTTRRHDYSQALGETLPIMYRELAGRITAIPGLPTGGYRGFTNVDFKRILVDLNLYNVELEIAPGQIRKIYYSSDRSEEVFIESDRKYFFDYLLRIEGEIVPLFQKIIWSHSDSLNAIPESPSEASHPPS